MQTLARQHCIGGGVDHRDLMPGIHRKLLAASTLALAATVFCLAITGRGSHRDYGSAREPERTTELPTGYGTAAPPFPDTGLKQIAGNAVPTRSSCATFRHVYFDKQKRGTDIEIEAREALLVLKMGANAEDIGDLFLQSKVGSSVQEPEVAALFGPEVARNLAVQDAGEWLGPLASKCGFHLFRVERPVPAHTANADSTVAARDFNWERRRAINRENFIQLDHRNSTEMTAGKPTKAGPPEEGMSNRQAFRGN